MNWKARQTDYIVCWWLDVIYSALLLLRRRRFVSLSYLSAPGNNIGECLACIIMMGVQPTVTGRDAPDVIEPSAEKTEKKGDTFFQLLDYFFISYMDERCHSKSWNKKIGLCIPLIHGWEELWNVGIYQDIIWWRPACYIDSIYSAWEFFSSLLVGKACCPPVDPWQIHQGEELIAAVPYK